MPKGKAARPRLTDMIRNSRAGDTFLVPSQVCGPVMRECHENGSALRVLFGLLWLSSEVMRSGARVGFRVSLAEVRIASGFETYGKDVPVLEVLDLLGDEVCDLEDGESIRVFESLSVVEHDARMLEWAFTEEFSELFVSPRVFAIVSILEIVNLKSGLDFFLYLQVRRIWKMQRKSVKLNAVDLRRAAGLVSETSFQRVAERVRRTARRLEKMLGGKIKLEPLKNPGARRHSEVVLEILEET